MIEHDGKKYTRVSTILRGLSDYSHIDPEILANKCRIGSEVHEAISNLIKGENFSLSEDCTGYFESFLCWKESLDLDFHKSEERIYDEGFMITGQIDAVALTYWDMKNVLIDFKTSISESIVWKYQAHFYMYLLNKKYPEEPKIERALFVKLDKFRGIPKIFVYNWDDNVWIKCKSLIREYRENEEAIERA